MEKCKLISKKIKGTILILLLLLGITSLNAQSLEENYNSLVVLKVQGLNAETYNKITAGINKESSITFEYSCLESDVIVIKCKHQFAQKADVQYFINNKFKQWIGTGKLEFIYLDVIAGGASKC